MGNEIFISPILIFHKSFVFSADMKMMNFASAIPDLNEVLKMDVHNEKALYRRALCRYKMGMYHEVTHS